MKWLIHHTKRILRITSGIVVLLLGLLMMLPGRPGPGLLLIFFGLSILAVDFVWAHRLKLHLRAKVDKITEKIRSGRKKKVTDKKI